MNMRLPDFVIIGSAKSGTTSLYSYLLDDESFYMCEPKEPEYFARDDVYKNGIDWYSGLFSNVKNGQLCGEASTLYSLSPLFPETAKRMYADIPDAKLIYIMRNPVKRAFSYYVQLVKNYQNCYKTIKIPQTFEEFIFNEDDKCHNNSNRLASFDNHLSYCPILLTAGGMYANVISKYLEFYDYKSIYFMIFEEFIADPLAEMVKLYNFLGVDPGYFSDNFVVHKENISDVHFRKAYAYNVLEKIKSLPLYGMLKKTAPAGANNLLIKFLSDILPNKFGGGSIKPSPMLKETEEYLRKLYLEPTQHLSELLGKDFVEYWKLDN